MTILPRTKSEFDDIVRRMTAFRLTSLIPLLSDPVDGPSLRRKMKGLLPEYSLTIGDEKPIWLPTLSTKQHGKRRVYSNMDILKPSPKEDYHLSYLSSNDLSRMRELNGSTAANATAAKMIRQFGDRWCITIGRPASQYKNATLLLQDILLIENEPSKANHPPVGTSSGLDCVWKLGPFGDELICQSDPNFMLGDEIVCTVSKHAI